VIVLHLKMMYVDFFFICHLSVADLHRRIVSDFSGTAIS